jgi:hypothetical protein
LRHPIIARIYESNVIEISIVLLVNVSAYQIIVIDRIKIIVECVELSCAFARRTCELIVYSIPPEEARIFRSDMGLPHQVLITNIRVRPGLDFIISTVTVHTLERELGMSWRNPHMAVYAGSAQKSGRTH